MFVPRRAFTLIEMLITIGLIMLLASLVIIVLRGVRESANRVESSNALRNMALAYTAYSTDHKQHLLPGYLSAARIEQFGINPEFPGGFLLNDPNGPAADPNDASAYVWRLAPYLDHAWRTYSTDYRSRELLAKLNDEHGKGIYGPATADFSAQPAAQMGISLIPSFGLNSIYLGGDDVHGGDDITVRNPWDNPGNKLAATRYSEVKNPARVIVFAPTVHWAEGDNNPGTELFPGGGPVAQVIFGYPELRAPYVDGVQQWYIQERNVFPIGDFFAAEDEDGRPIGGGFPVARWGKDQLPTAHLDGSVTTEDRNQMAEDMSLWLPDATGGYRPQG